MKNYLLVKLSSVNKIEDLHHNKSIKDEGEMTRIDIFCGKDCWVIVISADRKEPTTSYSSSNNSVVPFVSLMPRKNCLIVLVMIFWYKRLPIKDKDEHNNQLINTLPCNMLQHCSWYNILIPRMRLSLKQLLCRLFSSQCQRCKSVHDEIHPEHLNGL
jgi:hypothetical protein